MEIPLYKIYWDEEDLKAVVDVLISGTNWAIGSSVEEFEQTIANYVGREYALVFNSGTSALHALLIAYGINEKDEVIVPSFTFIATANAPVFVGATPVFADIEERTLGLDPKDVEDKITKKTKAIIAVHFAGCACEIKELRKIADKYNLILIEDAAEAMGAKIDGEMVGTFGDATMFSFCQNKTITTGDGGAITTNDKDIYEKLKLIRSHGGRTGFGYNFRLCNILSALGLSQLRKINMLTEMRRINADYMISQGVGKPPPENRFHTYQMFTIQSDNRDALKKKLADNGIASKVYFEPIHLTDFYKGKKGDLPITEKISKKILTLPMYPRLNPEEMDYIIKCFN